MGLLWTKTTGVQFQEGTSLWSENRMCQHPRSSSVPGRATENNFKDLSPLLPPQDPLLYFWRDSSENLWFHGNIQNISFSFWRLSNSIVLFVLLMEGWWKRIVQNSLSEVWARAKVWLHLKIRWKWLQHSQVSQYQSILRHINHFISGCFSNSKST